MCYKRLTQLANTPDVSFQMAETYKLQRQVAAAESIFSDLAPLFKITTRTTIPALAKANVPEKILTKLKPMTEVGYSTQEAFLERMYEVLDRDEIAQYGNLILTKSIFYDEYGPANFEVAMRLLNTPRPPDKQPQALQDAQLHLRRAIHFNKEKASEARWALATLLRAMNQPDEAESLLTEAVSRAGADHPEWRMMLADWDRQLGKWEPAKGQYEAAIVTLEKKVKDNMYDKDSRFRLIECLRVLGLGLCGHGDFKKGKEDLAHAVELCNTGRNLAQDPKVAQVFKVEVCRLLLAQYDGATNDPSTPPAERFSKLESALTLFPNDPDVLRRMVYYMRATGPEADAARKKIQDMIDKGTQSPVVYMLWGDYHWQNGNAVEAKFYWEKAMNMADWPAEVANNLAWIVAFHTKPPDLKRAKALVEMALQKDKKPEFYGTRGHILAEMGQDALAKPDLEEAKQAYANNPKTPKQAAELYSRLAKVCGNLGLKAEEEHNRKLAEQKMAEYYRTPAGRAAAAQAAAAQAKPASGGGTPPPSVPAPEKKDATGAPVTPKP